MKPVGFFFFFYQNAHLFLMLGFRQLFVLLHYKIKNPDVHKRLFFFRTASASDRLLLDESAVLTPCHDSQDEPVNQSIFALCLRS